MILDTRLSKAIEKHLNDNDEEINPLDEILRLIHENDEHYENDELDEMNFEEGDLLGEEIDAFIDAVHDSDVHACEGLDFILEIAKESEIDLVSLLKHISKRLHEPMPEPELEPETSSGSIEPPDSRALSTEGEYDEPMPENYKEIDYKMEDCINVLVYVLTHEYTFNNDDDLRTLLTHLLNNTYPPECSDELRVLIDDGREVIDDAIERIEYHHLDINEVVDYAMYTVNEQRRHPEWVL